MQLAGPRKPRRATESPRSWMIWPTTADSPEACGRATRVCVARLGVKTSSSAVCSAWGPRVYATCESRHSPSRRTRWSRGRSRTSRGRTAGSGKGHLGEVSVKAQVGRQLGVERGRQPFSLTGGDDPAAPGAGRLGKLRQDLDSPTGAFDERCADEDAVEGMLRVGQHRGG